ncbi:MAG: YjbF family lipoprotein [Rhodobacteraceae bacterium]|nr:YjbF family lipoprotein [Paracoccaceae bacterium]
MRFHICLIGLVLGLAACSKQEAQDPRKILTRARIDAPATPLLLAEIEEIETVATLAKVALNKTVETWQTGDQVSLSLDQGLVTATRGLGEDLMSADNSGTKMMLAGQLADQYYVKLHSYLDGEYQTAFRSFQCRRSGLRQESIEIFERRHATTRIEELCVTPGYEITNVYWQGADGFLWKTQQWLSPSLKYLVTEQLFR